jgi:signal transduction histidine kinase
MRKEQQQEAEDTDIETRARFERVLGMARVLFAIVTLVAIYIEPDALSPNASVAYELLTAYVSFSAILSIIARLAPSYLLKARFAIHLVDLLFATAITFLTRGSSSPFFVFFVFVLFAAPVRWGLTATLATGAVAVVVFLAEAYLAPLASPGGPGLEITRTVMRTSYLVVLTLMLAFTAAQERTFRAERNALFRVLEGIGIASSFSDGVRVFIDECLVRARSFEAVLVVENVVTQRLYLWSASRPRRGGKTTLVQEDLAPNDRQIYFAPSSGEFLVWYVRREKDGSVLARGLGATTLGTSIHMEGSFMGPVLDIHRVSSALTAEAKGRQDWRARLVLLDPNGTALDDLYFLRALVRHAAPALYNEFVIRRLRSRVSEIERARLAHELHDGLLQSLIGLEMEIEVLRRNAEEAQVSEVRLRQVRDQLRQEIAGVRDLMVQLRVAEMTGPDVLRIIAELARRLRRESGVDVRLVSANSLLDCAPRTCQHLARIVQEALTNVRKHSGARSVTITLTQMETAGRLVIEDNGRGLGFQGCLTLDQLEASDFGPAVIKERVRAMGGRLTIESRPGAGVRIDVEWPRGSHA